LFLYKVSLTIKKIPQAFGWPQAGSIPDSRETQ